MSADDFTPQRIHWLRSIWHRRDLVATLDAIEELQTKLSTTDKTLDAVPVSTAAAAMEMAERRFGPLRWEPGDTPHTFWGYAT